MAIPMSAASKMASCMAREAIDGKMDFFMKERSARIQSLGKENSNGLMEVTTSVVWLKAKETVLESTTVLLTNLRTKECGRKALRKAKVFLSFRMELSTKAISRQE